MKFSFFAGEIVISGGSVELRTDNPGADDDKAVVIGHGDDGDTNVNC